MASLPNQPPIVARVDNVGRLVAADQRLLALQEQAGSKLGGSLAVPQLAALARLAARLGVTITRPVMAASEEVDLDLLVRAEPDADGVTLSIEEWNARPPARPRRLGTGRGDQEADAEARAAAEDIVTDNVMRIVTVSPGLSRLLGDPEADLIGIPMSRLLRPVEDADGNIPMMEALPARSAFTGQPAVIRSNEARVLLDASPRLEDGEFVGYAIRIRNSDEPTAAKAALPPLGDLLSEPLASIIGQAEEIAARSQGPLKTDYAGYGTDIATAARHLLDVLTALGDDKQDADEAPAGEVLDLAELVLDAAGLVQAEASPRGILLDVAGEGSLMVRGQSRSITQILVNLIGNAVRFSPSGGTISLTLERGVKGGVIVSDEGPGVAPAERQRIFERYEQGADARGGTAGLGLAISRRLARDMGGEVDLLDLPSSGAAFRLTLPLA